jgi:dienelactone hydrolase
MPLPGHFSAEIYNFSLDGDQPRLVTTMPLGDLRSSRTLELRDGKLLMLDSRGTNFADVVELDLSSGVKTKLATASAADITDILTDGASGKLLAVREDPLVSRWTVLDPGVKADIDAIGKAVQRGWDVEGQSADDRTWLIYAHSGSAPDTYGLWDRDRKRYTPLYSSYADLDAAPLAPMIPVLIPTSDGLKLPSYLTLPRGKTLADFRSGRSRIPLVLTIHGGPWLRDRDEFDPRHQWLASQGYAALSVNYRGSVGFGRDFVHAADLQWSTRMHQDLIDAVDWAVGQGVADRDKVALYGLSYGGYSALISLSFTPDRFACAVDLAGPSELTTLLTGMPEWWTFQRPQFTNRIGDPDDPAGARELYQRSPISRVDQVRGPLLIGQGINDPRVPVYQSDLIARALVARKKPVTLLLYPDEGHVFGKERTEISFHAVAEKFLSQCLGGTARPFGGDLAGSRMIAKIGADRIDGLAEAIDRPTAASIGD